MSHALPFTPDCPYAPPSLRPLDFRFPFPVLPCRYQRFRVSADGELQGVGLLIANQMSDGGHLLVLAPIKGGPADRAGILPGDEVRVKGKSRVDW